MDTLLQVVTLLALAGVGPSVFYATGSVWYGLAAVLIVWLLMPYNRA